jgi:tetraacyldisaccharide 4'-kinase
MLQTTLARILLAPFSLLYGLGVSVRDWLYRHGYLKSVRFSLPVISVGNLSVGGAGKTPHIEYLILLLQDYLEIATLSRGYRRKTRGYLSVANEMNAEQVGDEPLQFKRKFPAVFVAVAEERAFAIPQILSDKPDTQLVLLDDAFQHRAVDPGLNILLTPFDKPFTRDYLLPSGRLREWRSAYQRADVVIVSKCPPDLDRAAADQLQAEIAPLPHQQLYFSYYDYGAPYYLFDRRYRLKWDPEAELILFCAIAGTDYLLDYLEAQARAVHVLEFADHHYFSPGDVAGLNTSFRNLQAPKKAIITTEKDAMRLELHRDYLAKQKLPIFVLPATVRFHFDEGPAFDENVRRFLLDFKS